ncbi:hypothetical protein EH223_10100 [candidate division KSB1 bacterium]|nr:outer membrane beta-barrel protein [candidate division KSB1 bacterium]RQW03398.1 MAG: hypothetical protein EH223_10100 [candidate division KSB1 bacterium]
MKKTIHIIVLQLCLCVPSALYSQGISRAQGVGFRLNFWNITGGRTAVSYNTDQGAVDVDLSGTGVSLYYFSRAYRDLFFEMTLGAIAGGEINSENFGQSDKVEVETIMPFLVGLRYDFMSTRVSGALHPYVAFGGGPYTAFEVKTQSRYSLTGETIDSGEGSVQTRMEYGWYLGGGVNFVLTSWFAINADLKYNFIDIPEVKDYSGVSLGVGSVFMWGKKKSIYEIKNIQLVANEIYPVSYQSYRDMPIVLVTVRNLAGHPIEVNIRGRIKGFTSRVKDSGYIRIKGGDVEEVPVYIFFGQQLMENDRNTSVLLDMDVEVRAATRHHTELSTELVIHGRNAWNGDMDVLPRFLTPEDKAIRDITRDVLVNLQEPVAPGLEKFVHARVLFNLLQSKDIKYLSDPNIPFYKDDRVQFAAETVDAGSGDCDDLVVLYASMLESVGIQTAFVEVQDPEKDLAHLYLLFNTGLKSEEGYLISDNEKRYIVRDTHSGQKMIWIPVETTLVQEGFENAWTTAAMAWLQESVLRNGITEDWVRIIDNY